MRFIDTSFLIALFRRRERHHQAAARLWADNDEPLMTTVGVCGETWTFLRRKEHHAGAVAAIDAIRRSPSITVTDVDANVVAAAWRWLRRHDEHPYSFVDATSFELMRRRRIREVLAFDDDFTRAGFHELR
jgi:predicted nucleic acid-binding protein